MNYFLIMALIGLCAKIWASYRLQQHWDKSPAAVICFAFLGLAYGQTVIELYGYYGLYNVEQYRDFNKVLILKLYYAFFITSLAAIPLLAIAITKPAQNTMYFIAPCVVIPLALTYTIFSSSHIVAGVKPLEHMFTRVPGEYYWLFPTYCLFIVGFTIATMVHCHRNGSELNKIKSINLLIGYLPLATSVSIIMPVMQLGFKISAAGTFPLFISIFIIVLSENLKSRGIIDLRTYIPWTRQSRTIREVCRPFRQIDLDPCDSKSLSKEYEQALIQHAIDILEDRKEAAQWLNISQAKISKRIGKRRSEEKLQES